MSESTESKAPAKPAPLIEDRDFLDLLKSLIGHVVTVVNPESYEDAPIGHQIRSGFYRAKLIGLGKDYLILVTEYVRKGTKRGEDKSKEPVRQFVPVSRIKRISILKSEKLIHL